MKKLKRVFLYLGMGSCVSSKKAQKLAPTLNTTSSTPTPTMEKTVISSVQPSIWQVQGSKEEQFFDSKAWLESDDDDFLSVNGDNSPPHKQGINGNGDHQGRRLSDLFKDSSSFSSESQTSVKAAAAAAAAAVEVVGVKTSDDEKKQQKLVAKSKKWMRSEKSMNRCLPSLVRSLSCGDRKKRSSHVAVAVAG